MHMHNKTNFICEENLRSQCSNGPSCPDHHFYLPYLWQVRINGQWMDLTDENSQIEEAYSRVEFSVAHISLKEVFCLVLK